jgi:transposase
MFVAAPDGMILKLGMWTRENRGRMADIARKTKRYPTDLTDEEWERIKPLLPKAPKRGRKISVDLREMLNAISYANKKIVGRKRHIAVDTDGRLLMVNLTTADISDSAGAQAILDAVCKRWPWLKPIRRRCLRPHQAARQSRFPRLRVGDRAPQRQGPRLRSAPAALGGRAHVRLDDALAQARARL